uniref:Apelin n=1 Tax=Sarcophilus harrisii TaxID=9305 RepID=A0A7N4NWZ6_SARHA
SSLPLGLQAELCTWSQRAQFRRPLLEALDRKELEEGNIRTLVQPKMARTGGPWQGGRRKFRRQRPRLSHKGPMPF